MTGLGGPGDRSLVDVDAETRAVESAHVAILVGEDGSVGQVMEQVRLMVVVNLQALFLDEQVRCGEADLQARGESDRPASGQCGAIDAP